MDTKYFAPVHVSMHKTGQLNNNTPVDLYRDAHQAEEQRKLLEANASQPKILVSGADNLVIKLPIITGIYTVEVADVPADKLYGTLNSFQIKQVTWHINEDDLHHACTITEDVSEGNLPNHQALMKEWDARMSAWERIADALFLDRGQGLNSQNNIDLHDENTRRDLAEIFGAHGFMQQSPDNMTPEDAYAQQFMRILTDRQGLNTAMMAYSFYEKYQEEIKNNNPFIAMQNTITHFEQEHIQGPHESTIFAVMKQLNATIQQREIANYTPIIDEILNRPYFDPDMIDDIVNTHQEIK
jgi:hypothetical protein